MTKLLLDKFILKVLFILLLALSISINGYSQKTWFGGVGNWATAGNWAPIGAPGAGDNVIINAGNVTFDANTPTSILSLQLNGTATFNFGTNASANTLTITNTCNLAPGTMLTFGTTPSHTLIISGDLIGSGTINMTGGVPHALNLGGLNNTLGNLITAVASSNITYNRAGNQFMFISPAYINLTISGSGIKELAGPGGTMSVATQLTVNTGTTFSLGANPAPPIFNVPGNSTINAGATFSFGTVSPKTATFSGATTTFNATCTVDMSGTGLPHRLFFNSNSNFNGNLTTTNGSKSTIFFQGSGNQNIFNKSTFQNVVISGAGTTKTLVNGAGPSVFNGKLTVTGGATLSMGTTMAGLYTCDSLDINNIGGASTLTFGGTLDKTLQVVSDLKCTPGATINMSLMSNHILRTSAINNIMDGSLIGTTGNTIDYNRSGNQNVFMSNQYQNLIISGTGTKTLLGNAIANGNLTVNMVCQFSMGTLGNLTVQGITTLAGDFNFGTAPAKSISFMGNLGGSGTIFMQGAGVNHMLNLNGATNTIGTLTTDDNSGSTIIYQAPATAQTILVTPNYQNVTMTGTGTKSTLGNIGIRGNLLINAPFNSNGQFIDIRGDWTNNNTFTQGTGTVTFNGTLPQEIGGGTVTNFQNLVINNTASPVTLTQDMIADNSTIISAGSVLDVQDFSGTDIGPTSGTGRLRITSISGTAGFPTGSFGPFFASGGGTVEFYGNTAYLLPNFNVNHLEITGASTKTLSAPATISNIYGNLTIDNTTTLSSIGTSEISLFGNILNNGILNAGHIFSFNSASTDQFINGTGSSQFNQLLLNKSNRNLILGHPIKISTSVGWASDGRIILGTNNLTMGASATFIGGPFSADRMIETDGLNAASGSVVKEGTVATNFQTTYPFGTPGVYSPATINLISASISGGASISLKPIIDNTINPGITRTIQFISTNITGVSSFEWLFQYNNITNTDEVGALPPDVIRTTGGTPFSVGGAGFVSGFNTSQFGVNSTYPFLDGIYSVETLLANTTFYSRGNLNWEDPTAWSTDPVLKYSGASCGCFPNAADAQVHIGGGFTITKSTANPLSMDSLVIDATGVLDMNTQAALAVANFSNLGQGGNGTIRFSSGFFPFVSVNNNFSSAIGTGWGTIEYYGGAYVISNNLTQAPNLLLSGNGINTLSTNITINNNLTLTNNATLDLGTIVTDINVIGNTTLTGGNTLSFGGSSSKTFLNNGNFTSAGSVNMNFSGTNRLEILGTTTTLGSYSGNNLAQVRYTGTGTQLISASGYYNLHISGGLKRMQGITQVFTNLSLGGAILATEGFHFLLYDPATISGLAGSTSNHIRTNGGGLVNLILPATGPYNLTVPMGSPTQYMPVIFNLTSYTSTGPQIQITAQDGAHANIVNSSVALQGYWDVASFNINNITGNIRMYYQNGMDLGSDVNYVSGFYNGSWITGTTTDVTEGTNEIIFNKTAATDLSGSYTAGELPAFLSNNTYFSRISGTLEDATTVWSTDPILKHGGAPCACAPPASGAVVKIGAGHTITKSTNNAIALDSLTISNTGVFDKLTNTGLSINVFDNQGLGGNGIFRTSDNLFPAVTTNNFLNAQGTGDGTVEYSGGTYSPPAGITSYRNITFSGTAGNIKSLTTNYSVAGNVSIIAPSSVILAANTINRTAAGGSFTIANGAFLNIAGTNTFPSNYTTITLGPSSNVIYNGTAQNISNLAGQSYGNLSVTTAGTKTLVGNTLVAGNLSISPAGGIISMGTGNYTLNITGNTTITGTLNCQLTGTGNIITIGGNLSGTGIINMTGVGVPHVLNLGGTTNSISAFNSAAGNGSVVNYNRAGNQTSTIGTANYRNVVISGSGIKTFGLATTINDNLTIQAGCTMQLTALSDLSIGGNATIDGALQYNSSAARIINIAGNLSGTGSITMSAFIDILNLSGPLNNYTGSLSGGATTAKVAYVGTGNQTVFPSTNYKVLEVSGGGTKTLLGNLTVNRSITLNGALIDLTGFNIIYNSDFAIGGTKSATNMLLTSGTGSLIKNYTTTGPFEFPVGKGGVYSPLFIDVTAGAFAAANISCRVDNIVAPNEINPTLSLLRHWNLNSSGITGLTANLTFTYTDPTDIQGTEASYIGAHYPTALPWLTDGTVTAASNTINFTKTGTSTNLIGNYTAGHMQAFSSTPVITGASPDPVCQGQIVTINGFNFTGTTLIDINGTNVPSFTIVNDNTITLTVPLTATTGLMNITNAFGTGTSPSNVNVSMRPQISIPATLSICENGNSSIVSNLDIMSGGPYNYQWRQNGSNLSDAGAISGSATSVLMFTGVPYAFNGTNFDVIVSGFNTCKDTSGLMALTVYPITVVNPVGPYTISSGQTTNIPLSSTPAGATFSWTVSSLSGSISGQSAGAGTTISQTLTGNGVIRYTVTPDYSGCPGTPFNIDVTV